MELKLLRTSHPTSDSVSLWFEKGARFQTYKSGQHAVLTFKVGDQKIVRSYSMHTSSDIDKEVGITVRALENGIVSNYLLQNTVDNIAVQLERINGDFTIEPSPDIKRHLIMFAGGSGITPIFSMLRTILYNEPRSSVSLIYSNKTYSRIIFNSELHSLEKEFGSKLKVYHIITQDKNIPSDFPVFYKGRLTKLITKKIINSILSEISHWVEYYLSGPYPFMQLVEETIRSINPERVKIFKENFFVPGEESKFDYDSLKSREVIIQIKDDEKLLLVEGGKSILQAALEHDIKLPYSCSEGQCGTCRAILRSGGVKLRKNHILNDKELSEGQILLCQGFPISDDIIIKARL